MANMPQKLYMAFCIGTLSIALSACGDKIQTVDSATTPPKPPNTKLPMGFPVPIYPGADVVNVDEVPMQNAGKVGYLVHLSTPDDTTKVESYYAYTLGKAGWSARVMKMESYGLSSAKCLVASNADNQITANITSENNKTTISISLTPISAYSPTSQQK